jgi:hypothetical protein
VWIAGEGEIDLTKPEVGGLNLGDGFRDLKSAGVYDIARTASDGEKRWASAYDKTSGSPGLGGCGWGQRQSKTFLAVGTELDIVVEVLAPEGQCCQLTVCEIGGGQAGNGVGVATATGADEQG